MVVDHRFPSLASIRAFEAAARLGSFAKAAQELDTTAASVSYHVRQLEKQIGVVLFRRHPQKVELTEPGQLIATEAMNAFAALRASFIMAADLDQSRLSITTLPTIGTSWLTPRLGRFRAKHPEIQFELELSADAHDLTAGRFDAAIRNGHGRWPGLRTVKLFPSIFMPLCTPALKHAAAALADPRRALDIPLLGRADWWQLWYRTLGFADAPALRKIGANLSAEYLDITQALAGDGIAIGSPILFRNEIDAAVSCLPTIWSSQTGERFGSLSRCCDRTAIKSSVSATGCAMKPRAREMPRRISSNVRALISCTPYPQSLPVQTESDDSARFPRAGSALPPTCISVR